MPAGNRRSNVRVRTLSPALSEGDVLIPVFDADDLPGPVQLPVRAWATGGDLPCPVEYLVKSDPKRGFVAVEFTFRPRRGGVDTKTLRAAINVPDLVAMALESAATGRAVAGKPGEKMRQFTRSRSRGTPNAIRDDELLRVLKFYDKGGTAAVVEHWHVERTTAWRAVKRAQAQKGKR
jgi:hypothetical protein